MPALAVLLSPTDLTQCELPCRIAYDSRLTMPCSPASAPPRQPRNVILNQPQLALRSIVFVWSLGQCLNLFCERVDVLKIPIDRGEPDVGHPVEYLQSLDTHLTDHTCLYLRFRKFMQLVFYIDNHLRNGANLQGSFGTGSPQRTLKLFRRKRLTAPVSLGDHQRHRVNTFVGCEPQFAPHALASPTHAVRCLT